MTESREMIAGRLSKYLVKDLRLLFSLFRKIILANGDFRFQELYELKNDDMYEVVAKSSKAEIVPEEYRLLDDDGMRLWLSLNELDHEEEERKTKLKKKEIVNLMADCLAHDALFEGMCLAFYENDVYLESLCNDFRCPEKYDRLSRDLVFRKRRDYYRMIVTYIRAAVNLYGVIHIAELENLIEAYEKHFRKMNGFVRGEGTYRKTIMYSPGFFSDITLHEIVGNAIPSLCGTFDGFAVHNVMQSDVMLEAEELFAFLDTFQHEGKNSESDFHELMDTFFSEETVDNPHRILAFEASEKPMYQPSRREFLKYADDSYYEVSSDEKQWRDFLKKQYSAELDRLAMSEHADVEEILDAFFLTVHEWIMELGMEPQSSPTELIQDVMDLYKEFGIYPDEMDELNLHIGFIMETYNHSRLWINHGYTPDELRRMHPGHSRVSKVVPNSSLAAEMLEQTRDYWKNMGVDVDLASNAVTVPSFIMEPDGQIREQKENRIYPNDPCPCGSGKKFKKCCGRNRNV